MSRTTKKYKTLIAVPMHNQWEYTKKLCESLLIPPTGAFLMIDNGSDDETKTHTMTMAKVPDVYVCRFEENKGVSSAWNTALALGFEDMRADEVIILNNDILMSDDTIKKIIDDLRGENVGLATATDVMGECATEEEFFAKKAPDLNTYIEEPDFACFGINKKCFEQVGYFDENFYPAYFEDNDYHYRMRLANLHAIKNKNNYFWHYGSKTLNTTPTKKAWFGEKYSQNALYFQVKWGGKPGEEVYKQPFNGEIPPLVPVESYEAFLKNNQIKPQPEKENL